MTIFNADNVSRLLIAVGISYSCYMWICESLPDRLIFLKAAWNAQHLHALSETCEDLARPGNVPERWWPWYEAWLQCSGDRWGLEMWRTYRDYTSPHFLLLYIMLFICAYFTIRSGRRLLVYLGSLFDEATDNEPPAIDDLPAPPGGYKMFSYSHVAMVEATASSRIEQLTNEVEASKQREKETRAGALIRRVLLKAVHVKETSKLKNQLRAEKRQIWELKSPASSSRVSPAASLFGIPSQDNTRTKKLEDELATANEKIKDLEAAATSSTTSRKVTVKLAPPPKSNAAEAAENAKLRKDLDEANKAIKALETAASSSSNSENKARKLDDENKGLKGRLDRVREELASTERDLNSCKQALERKTGELHQSHEELRTTHEKLEKADSHLASSRTIIKGYERACANAKENHGETVKQLSEANFALTMAQNMQEQLNTLVAESEGVRQQLERNLTSASDLRAGLTVSQCIGKLQQELETKESDLVKNQHEYELERIEARKKLVNTNNRLEGALEKLADANSERNAVKKQVEGLKASQRKEPLKPQQQRSHPEYFEQQQKLAKAQTDLAVAEKTAEETKTALAAKAVVLAAKDRALAVEKARNSAENDYVIRLLTETGRMRLDVAKKTKDLAEAKKMVEEQGEMISKLQGVDDLF